MEAASLPTRRWLAFRELAAECERVINATFGLFFRHFLDFDA
jgi:hypothetical protein